MFEFDAYTEISDEELRFLHGGNSDGIEDPEEGCKNNGGGGGSITPPGGGD